MMMKKMKKIKTKPLCVGSKKISTQKVNQWKHEIVYVKDVEEVFNNINIEDVFHALEETGQGFR